MGEQSGFQLSGNAPEAYERYIVPALFNEWAHDLIETAAVQAGERALDVACGTGRGRPVGGPRGGRDRPGRGGGCERGHAGHGADAPPTVWGGDHVAPRGCRRPPRARYRL